MSKKLKTVWPAVFALAMLALAIPARAQVTVEPAGISLKELIGTTTMVTVVIKASGAQDPNLRVADVTSNLLSVVDERGQRWTYTFDSIAKVVVQGGAVEKTKIDLGTDRQLKVEEQAIVKRALERAGELFKNSQDNQLIRGQAASILANNNDVEALTYLLQLIDTQDPPTETQAANWLYQAGFYTTPAADSPAAAALAEAEKSLTRDEPLSLEAEFQRIVLAGLESGNRAARGQAGLLAGLAEVRSAIPLLNRMFQDRAAELSAPAAISLSRLGVEEARPRLIDMLDDGNEVKRVAATVGLLALNSPGLAEALAAQAEELEEGNHIARFQYGLTLFELGSDTGKQMLRNIVRNVPTLADQAALFLAESGDWDAMQYVRERLERRVSDTPENLMQRALQAGALVKGGDASGIAELHKLLGSDNPLLVSLVCMAIIDVGQPNLLTILQASIENADVLIASDAVQAAYTISSVGRRDRFQKLLLSL